MRRRPSSATNPLGRRSDGVRCGTYGRVGRVVAEALRERGLPYRVVEQNRQAAQELQRRGVPAVYGDASSPDVPAQTGLQDARLLVMATPDPPRSRNPAVSPAMDALILRLLEKDPGRRPSSGAEVAAAIRDLIAGDPMLLDATAAPVAVGPTVPASPTLIKSPPVAPEGPAVAHGGVTREIPADWDNLTLDNGRIGRDSEVIGAPAAKAENVDRSAIAAAEKANRTATITAAEAPAKVKAGEQVALDAAGWRRVEWPCHETAMRPRRSPGQAFIPLAVRPSLPG